MQPGQPADAAPPSESLSLGRGEVIMTAEQAKTAKVQKGFVLQPVMPSEAPEPARLPEKRERKRSNHFGHSPEPEGSVAPSPRTYRPKAVRPPSINGSPMPEPPAPVGAPTPWSDRKKMLQERLRRINAQLKKVGAGVGAMTPMAIQPPASPAHVPMPIHGALPSPSPYLTPIHESRVHTPTGNGEGMLMGGSNKRKASLERSISASKIDLPKRPRSGKGKKGDRLVPYGKLRNIYFHCEKLLESLMKDALAKLYFNVPVDPIALGIPHYTQIITEPMDLGTIRLRLENEYYDDVLQLHSDLNLVWDNAMHFNPPGTDVHESAKVLKESTDKRIKKLPKLPGAPNLDLSGVDSGGEMGQRKMADLMRKMEKMQSDLANMKQGGGSVEQQRRGSTAAAGSAAAPKKRGSTSAAPTKKAMTFEEKRQLSLNINKLDEDKLGKVVEIIKKRKSHIMGKDSEEIEIDIDSLDNATLRELEKYVDECLRPKPAAQQKLSKNAQLQSAARQAIGGVSQNTGSPASSSDSDSDSDSDGGMAGGIWGPM